jgi:hypothetical protein
VPSAVTLLCSRFIIITTATTGVVVVVVVVVFCLKVARWKCRYVESYFGFGCRLKYILFL